MGIMVFVTDMAANWDSCVGLSCLKHGLTVHSAVEVAPPYPSFDISVSIKLDNKVIINTGNFLHVLSVDLENSQQLLKQPSTTCDTIRPAEINHQLVFCMLFIINKLYPLCCI